MAIGVGYDIVTDIQKEKGDVFQKVGKSVVHAGVNQLKSAGPIEYALVGAAVGGPIAPVTTAVGFAVGSINAVLGAFKPEIKDKFYGALEKGGDWVVDKIDDVGKSIGKAAQGTWNSALVEESMHMVKKLFGASFEESKKIAYNLFKEKKWYDTGAEGSQNIGARIFNIVLWIAFSVVFYGIGVLMPETAFDSDSVKFNLGDIYFGISNFNFLKSLILWIIILWGLLLLLNIVPKSNYSVTRLFEIGNLFFITLLCMLSIMPMCLGMTLGATGWFGFSIICICGLIFFVRTLVSRMRKIKVEMYGEVTDSSFNIIIDKLWNLLKKYGFFLLAIVVLNILTLRIGMRGSFSLWSFICMFAGPIYFGLLTLFIVGLLKIYVNSFYLVKYAEQYRILWKVTDEQWYGKRRAKKLAKKKLKQERKGK